MIRIVKLSEKFYGVEISEDEIYYEADKIVKTIENFVVEGTPVILVDTLEDLEILGITDEVIMVKNLDV
jgi:hypothetical protein